LINAKNIFILEEEMARYVAYLTYEAGLSSEEQENIFAEFGEMTEQRYEELLKTLSDRQTNPLARLKNGEGVSMKDINKAVRQAANDPKT
jgi:ABC-type transporter MlaC component